jgi:enoyl-CoA hydratase/carnithine racemase
MSRELVAQYETLLVEREGPVATLTMNRPAQMNALYRQSYLDFEQAFIWARDDDSVRVVVITGAGERAFCAGGDKHLDLPVLSTLGSAGMLADARIAQDTIRRIRELDKPVLARVNGVAVGGGCDIALACDIVIASRNASFGELWILRGILPAMGGGYFLPRLVGTHRAKELIFTGDRIDAEEAERIGMINRVVDQADLDEAVYGLAARLVERSALALGISKKLIDEHAERSLGAFFEASAWADAMLVQSDDHHAGVADMQS